MKRELEEIEDLKVKLTDSAITTINVSDMLDAEKQKSREAVISIISKLSERIREIKELKVSKKRALKNILAKVPGNWRDSKLSSAISYLQGKLINFTACIKTLLNCVDDLGYLVSHLNGTESAYVRGSGVTMDLNSQPNYTCLRNLDEDTLSKIDHEENSRIIKQRSPEWKSLREHPDVVVTGSGLNNAIGLGTLKQQRNHVMKLNGTTQDVDSIMQERFDYGTKMEKHALGVLLGKFMPIYWPELRFVEDGCEIMILGGRKAVISGDGTGVDNTGENTVAFELKCPMPGKEFTTDTYYKLKQYYGCQVLSQMKAKSCDSYANVCYTPESSTLIVGNDDTHAWNAVHNLTLKLYGKDQADISLPTRKDRMVNEVLPLVSDFCEKSKFMAEFPSLVVNECTCGPVSDIRYVHGGRDSKELRHTELTLDEGAAFLLKSGDALKDAYELLRKQGKDLLITMAGDTNRISSKDAIPHTVPIMYHISGHSLKMSSVRKILNQGVELCSEQEVNICAVNFDGQFLEICVHDDEGRPLTICQL